MAKEIFVTCSACSRMSDSLLSTEVASNIRVSQSTPTSTVVKAAWLQASFAFRPFKSIMSQAIHGKHIHIRSPSSLRFTSSTNLLRPLWGAGVQFSEPFPDSSPLRGPADW